MNLYLLLLIPLFAFADRFTGGGFGWNKLAHDHGGPLHGRGAYYAVPLAIGVCYAMGGLHLAAFGLIWGLYRAALGFWTGTLDGKNVPLTLTRHLLLVPAVLAVAVLWHRDLAMALPFVGYGLMATILAVEMGNKAWDTERPQDINGTVEITRGALFGLTLVIITLFLKLV